MSMNAVINRIYAQVILVHLLDYKAIFWKFAPDICNLSIFLRNDALHTFYNVVEQLDRYDTGGRVCTNTFGGFRCDCPSGYSIDPKSGICQDVDECKNPYTVCGLDSECQNSLGSYRFDMLENILRCKTLHARLSFIV